MWALYNSYHYDCLDRSNYQKKENKSEIKKKKTIYNPERQNYDDIFCQGNKIFNNRKGRNEEKETENNSELKKFKRITPFSKLLWEKSVKEADLRKKHGRNVGKIYNESYDMSFREFPDEYLQKNNPNVPKFYEELDSDDLSWMNDISLTDLHSNLTLDQQYFHLKDMEKYYLVELWRSKWKKIRPERDYWYELRDNTFWMEARRNRLTAYNPEIRSYFLKNLENFYQDQKSHFDKYKNNDFKDTKEYAYLKKHFKENNKEDNQFIQQINNNFYKLPTNAYDDESINRIINDDKNNESTSHSTDWQLYDYDENNENE
ncbi:hypothetical protein LY90DRAFT_665425 [Neocallimastix californiae]|uniref:Uncharacterized protein n=1 Tax=Neocallimastix californiae TaxID=1754190 RepID=A0A1Y2F2G6_9FUNG|nr:hypothetical protein LY90DRAFT_665425 [Neocallimastix californiae]|eukprot:ORY77165.1 hypothetical protein LY90DRAFT_665425 [Neocallimastix californiae]